MFKESLLIFSQQLINLYLSVLVFLCGQNIRIGLFRNDTEKSGVLISHYPPDIPTNFKECKTEFKNIEPCKVYITLELFHFLGARRWQIAVSHIPQEREGSFRTTASSSKSLSVLPISSKLTLSFLRKRNVLRKASFVVRYRGEQSLLLAIVQLTCVATLSWYGTRL